MTVSKRPNGRYAVQVYDAQKKRSRQVGTYSTLREARKADRAARTLRGSDRETVASFHARWMIDYRGSRADSTRKHYHERTLHFVAEHGGRYLDQIDRKTARAWALDHPSEHPSLRVLFSDAYKDDLVSVNPFADLGIRRKGAKRDLAPEWLLEEDVQQLAATARLVHDQVTGTLVSSALVFCAYTGIRPGEMYALEYGDVDLASSTVRIDRAARSSTRTIDLPKHNHRRTIVLTEPARAAFETVPLLHDRLVFPTPTGKQCWSPRWSGLWSPVRNAAGRPKMHWHELRHFAATWLLELGLSPADVAVQMGHRDGGQLVMQIYGHPSERRARDRIRQATEQNYSHDYSRSAAIPYEQRKNEG